MATVVMQKINTTLYRELEDFHPLGIGVDISMEDKVEFLLAFYKHHVFRTWNNTEDIQIEFNHWLFSEKIINDIMNSNWVKL